MKLQQSRRIIKSSVKSNQQTHMIYGKMDVVESRKGSKKKRPCKTVDIFFF